MRHPPRLFLLVLAACWVEHFNLNVSADTSAATAAAATAAVTAAKQPMTRLDCWRRNAPGMPATAHHNNATLVEPGRSWHILDKACRTAFLLDESIAPLSTPRASILFLGDSVDAFNMYELCEAVNSTRWFPGDR